MRCKKPRWSPYECQHYDYHHSECRKKRRMTPVRRRTFVCVCVCHALNGAVIDGSKSIGMFDFGKRKGKVQLN